MKRILAALDFSDATPRVVREAAKLASALGARVVLLHVTQIARTLPRHPTEMRSLGVARRAQDATVAEQLAAVVRSLRRRGVTIESLRRAGDPKTEISKQANKLAADYVMVGSHGHSALHDVVAGSTTAALIKGSKRVVVVVPVPRALRSKRDDDDPAATAVGYSHGDFTPASCTVVKTILAAVDFSPVTKRVVAEAVRLARAARARVVFLNVTSPASLLEDHAALEAMINTADPRGRTGGAVERSAIHGDSLQIIGNPIEVILEQAARCSADFIVMGSHGHTALFNLMVGGTAAGVIRGAKCPVIMVPPPARKSGKSRATILPRRMSGGFLQREARRAKRDTRSAQTGRGSPPTSAPRGHTLSANVSDKTRGSHFAFRPLR